MKKIVGWFKETYKKIKGFFIKVDTGIDNKVDKVTGRFSKIWSKYNFLVFLLVFTALSLVLKFALVNVPSWDYISFIQQWNLYMRENGGFVKGVVSLYENELGQIFLEGIGIYRNVPTCDYPPLYMYFLSLISVLPLGQVFETSANTGFTAYWFYTDMLMYVKILSFIFEIIFATFAYKIVKKVSGSKVAACTAYSLFLFLPTVVLNGAVWGQCDVCYASMVVASVYYLISKKQIKSMIFFGLAIAFKLQAVFIIPVFGFAWFRKSFKIRYVVVAALTLLVTFLPLWMAGANIGTPFIPYTRQFGGYITRLNLNSTNLYALFELNGSVNKEATKFMSTFGIILTVVVSFVLISVLAMKRVKVTPKSLFTIATLSVILVPFIMPHMHDRYFYLAETFFVMYACTKLNRIHLPIVQQVSGLIAYSCYGIITPDWFLNDDNGQRIALCIGTLLNASCIGFLIYDVAKLETEPKQIIPEKIDNIAENSAETQ